MESVTRIKLITLSVAVFFAVCLDLSHLSFAGGILARSDKGGSFRATRRPAPSLPKRQKFFVVEDRFEQSVSVSVQQTFVVSPPESKKTVKNMIYIQPRWVETEHGVLVSEPGRWVELEPGAEY